MNNDIIEEIVAGSIDFVVECTQEVIIPYIKDGYKYTRYMTALLWDASLRKYIHIRSSNKEYIKIKKVSVVDKNFKEIKIFDTLIFDCLRDYLSYSEVSEKEVNLFRSTITEILKNENCDQETCYMYISYIWLNTNTQYLLCIENPHKEKQKSDKYPFIIKQDHEYEYQFVSHNYNYYASELLKKYEGPYRDFHSDFCNITPRIILNTPMRVYENKFLDQRIKELLIINKTDDNHIVASIGLDSSVIEEIEYASFESTTEM